MLEVRQSNDIVFTDQDQHLFDRAMLKFNELTLPDLDFENGHILETSVRICNWQSKKDDEKVSLILSCDSKNKKASITL